MTLPPAALACGTPLASALFGPGVCRWQQLWGPLSWLLLAQRGTAQACQQQAKRQCLLLPPQLHLHRRQEHQQQHQPQHQPQHQQQPAQPPWQQQLPRRCMQQQQPGSCPVAPWPSEVLSQCMPVWGQGHAGSRGYTRRGSLLSSALVQARRFGTASSEPCSSSTSSSTSKQQFVLDFVHTQDPSTLLGLAAKQAAAAGPVQAAAAAASKQPHAGSTPAAAAAGALHPGQAPRGKVVAVAMSGGVDSAVSALLLQAQGYQLFGVFMHNWDAADEAGAGTPTCTAAEDLADAQAACRALGIPLLEADFVSRYWNEVFEAFLQGLSRGLTPNPDLACNSHIKFGALLQFAKAKGADVLATGHYARLGWTPAVQQPAGQPAGQGHASASAAPAAEAAPAAVSAATAGEPAAASTLAPAAAAAVAAAPCDTEGWRPVLLTGADPSKDQTYFLAGLTHQQLAQAMFPVGHLTKAQVRDIAAAAGLPQASKRSSAGICFIGRRSFGQFLEAYLVPQPGQYVDADAGAVLGPCSNMLAVTVGQKALGLGGQKVRAYVVGKHLQQRVVYVAAGPEHPALYSREVLLQGPSWVRGQPPAPFAHGTACEADLAPQAAGAGDVGLQHTTDAAAGPGKPSRQVSSSQHVLGTDTASDVPSGVLHCHYQARYRQSAAACSIRALTAAEAAGFRHSRFCQGPAEVASSSSSTGAKSLEAAAGKAAAAGENIGQYLLAELQEPLRGVAPGQMFVMYDGQQVLGAATIVAYGPTRAESGGA